MSHKRTALPLGRLLLVLFVLMIAHPFVSSVWVLTTLVAVVLTVTVFSATHGRLERASVLVLGAGYIVTGIMLARPDHGSTVSVLSNAVGILFFGLAISVLLRAVFRTTRVDHNALFGAASIYLLFSVLAARAFVIIQTLIPGAFVPSDGSTALTWVDFQYFSLVTLTTVGFGDIQPVHPVARAVTVFVAVCGVFYMAFLVARLVAMHIMDRGDAGRSA